MTVAAEIEKDLISKRTKVALKARKAMGIKFDRPIGPGKSKLDKHREEIIALLKNGSSKNPCGQEIWNILPQSLQRADPKRLDR